MTPAEEQIIELRKEAAIAQKLNRRVVHRLLFNSADTIERLQREKAELEAVHECESCGADCRGPQAGNYCHGCGKHVCLSCVTVFDHFKDGEHGCGDPVEQMSETRTRITELEQQVAGLKASLRSAEDQLCSISRTFGGKDARHVKGDGDHTIAAMVEQRVASMLEAAERVLRA